MYKTKMIDCFVRKGLTRPDAAVAFDAITALLSGMLGLINALNKKHICGKMKQEPEKD